MTEFFEDKITEIYNLILEPVDIMYKFVAINKYKADLNIGKHESFSEYYINIIQNKKTKGTVYTPIEIAKYIVQNTIMAEDIIKNPFLKIVDPTCGCGNLIIPCFTYLKQIYKNNLDEINKANNINLSETDIDIHIIENNLYGFDIDEFALKILIIDLFIVSYNIKIENFIYKDFLLEENEEKFDIFIGNPPYIGQKVIDKEYSSKIKKLYKNLYKDKSDISYCFFGAALNKLKKGGKLTFISSRYFLESQSGEELRKTLKDFCSINKIVDFYGIRPFKNIGIDPVIILLTFEENDKNIQVIKPLIHKEKEFFKSVFFNEGNSYISFSISKSLLNNKRWILRDEVERTIINKIEKKCLTSLGNVCDSFQGIITGCDKAFVVDACIIEKESLELDVIKPWIKSSFIKKETVNRENTFLIYSDLIEKESEYPYSMKHIAPFKQKLMERRECKKGVREWYQLQWGRAQSIFEGEKIVFPFKSNKNRFSIDIGSYFSADVYCLILKEGTPFTYDFLIKLLNSKIYEYYFKTFAKKLGEDIYEYYPNNLIKLCIPTMMDIEGEINSFLYKFFGLNDNEIDIIEKYIDA